MRALFLLSVCFSDISPKGFFFIWASPCFLPFHVGKSLSRQYSSWKILLSYHFWTLDVSRTAPCEITLVRLSVCPSVLPSLSFLKIGSLVFSDIVHDDSWPWYLVAARFLKKKIGDPNLDQMGQNWAQNWVFWHFLKFGSLFFLEIACNDSLQQCLIYSREKIDEKFFWGPNLGHRDQNLFQN